MMSTSAIPKAPKSVLEYKVDPDDSVPRRLSKFLFWASEKMPGRAIPMPLVAKVVLILPKVPVKNSKDVQKITGRLGAARDLLGEEHERGLISVPGMGIRATTGSEDTAKTQYEKNAKRVVSAVTSLDRTRSIIKTNEIQDARVRARVGEIGKAAKVLVSPDILDKLRLPAPKEDEEK